MKNKNLKLEIFTFEFSFDIYNYSTEFRKHFLEIM